MSSEKKLKEVYDKKTKTNVFQTKKIISENPSRYTPSNRVVSDAADALLNKYKTRERGSRLSVSDVEMLMDAMPKYNVGGHSVMGSPISVDADGETLTNPSAKGYYKGMLVED
jgi:Na+-transporting NADH:ubiquinone oxidoreductase subunit NqrC